jgi:hypothetical protein
LPIQTEEIVFALNTDASLGNLKKHRTQAGHLIAAVGPELNQNSTSPWSLLTWKSGHLKRTVESTLGSETQALLRGVKELEWIKTMWCSMLEPIDLGNREGALKKVASIAIVDCKSAYDAVTSLTGTSVADRTTALDALVVKEVLQRANIIVRWVPSNLQLADSLTKDSAASCDLLRGTVRSGEYTIGDEVETLQRRAKEKALRLKRGAERAQESEEENKKRPRPTSATVS